MRRPLLPLLVWAAFVLQGTPAGARTRARLSLKAAELRYPTPDAGTRSYGTRVKLLVVTASMLYPCKTHAGGYLMQLSVKNKQDYAQLHGYGFHWNAVQLDARLAGPWNKVAVLRQLLRTYGPARVEWVLWVDNDTLFGKMDRVIPFERYADKNVVVWADYPDRVLSGLDARELNTGVVLLRNNNWTRNFVEEWARLGVDWGLSGSAESKAAKEMEAGLVNFSASLFDQAALAWLIKRDADVVARVFLENKWEYGFHTHFQGDMPLDKVGVWTMPLTLHYAGCQFCSYGEHQDQAFLRQCVHHFLSIFGLALNQTSGMLGEGQHALDVGAAYQQLAAVDTHLRWPNGQQPQQD